MKGAKTYWGPTQSYKFQNIQRRVWWKEAKEAKEPRGPPNAYYSLCVVCVTMQKKHLQKRFGAEKIFPTASNPEKRVRSTF